MARMAGVSINQSHGGFRFYLCAADCYERTDDLILLNT